MQDIIPAHIDTQHAGQRWHLDSLREEIRNSEGILTKTGPFVSPGLS